MSGTNRRRREPVFKRSQEIEILMVRVSHLQGMVAAHQTLIGAMASQLDETSRKRIELLCKMILGRPLAKSELTGKRREHLRTVTP